MSRTILGLDEAGRGCVLGDLVVGAFLVKESDLKLLQQTGVTDSKKLSAKKREHILTQLPSIGTCSFVSITPKEIDNGNLNRLEEQAFITLIVDNLPDVVIIDAPTHPRGIPAVLNRIQTQLKSFKVYSERPLPDFIIEPKADLNYPAVSAASVVAKVQRDQALLTVGFTFSGYPSDPKTRSWLKEYLRLQKPFPSYVRTRWGTIDNLRKELEAEQLTIPWSEENSSSELK
jgi:ribonuclease HII